MCVNLLIGAANHDIDIKFGVTINDQLSDEILVSVIASDFENEIDFSQPMTFTQTRVGEDQTLFQAEHQDAPVQQPEQNNFEGDSILPDFLKGIN